MPKASNFGSMLIRPSHDNFNPLKKWSFLEPLGHSCRLLMSYFRTVMAGDGAACVPPIQDTESD